jgi:hypothetical protein
MLGFVPQAGLQAFSGSTDFESLNNAINRASFVMHSSQDWQKLADDWQSYVVDRRTVLSALPPTWAALLQQYWERYIILWGKLPADLQARVPNPTDALPGGVSKAITDLYAPTKDTAKNVVSNVNAAIAAKARELGKEAGAGAQESIDWGNYLLWGAAGAGALWVFSQLLRRA